MFIRFVSLMALCGLIGAAPAAQLEGRVALPKTFLGILAEPATADTGKPGLMVREVTLGSPADKAGLKRGDEIVKVDNKSVKDFPDLVNVLNQHKPGDKLNVQAMRDGKEQTMTVTLGEPPARAVNPPRRTRPTAFLGVRTGPLTPEEKTRLGVAVDRGAIVMDVMPDTPAAKAGLQRGDVITRVDDKAINTPEDLQQAVGQADAGKAVTVTLVRGKETKKVQATLAEPPAGPFRRPRPENQGALDRIERRLDRLEQRVQGLEQRTSQKTSHQ